MQDIYILGSGSMGCLWASYFEECTNIHFITRSLGVSEYTFNKQPQNQNVRSQKIGIDSLMKTPDKIKFLIVCTKAFDALNAITNIQQKLAKNCQIILIQNGMGSQQSIADAFPKLAVYACSSTEGAYKKSENTLIHAGAGENHIGPMTQHATIDKLCSWLPHSCYQWHDVIEPILWKKLVINAAINPLTVVYQCQNGELLTHKKAHEHMKNLCLELDELCIKLNFNLTPTLSLAETICHLTAKNYSSMFQDNKHHRQTEIEYITGFVINECNKLSIPCPINQSLYSKISG